MSVEPTGINWTVVYIWLFVAQWVFNLGASPASHSNFSRSFPMAYVNQAIFVPLADVTAANLSVSMIDGCGAEQFLGSATSDPGGSPDFISHRVASGGLPEEVAPIMWSSAIIESLDGQTYEQAAAKHGLYAVKWPD